MPFTGAVCVEPSAIVVVTDVTPSKLRTAHYRTTHLTWFQGMFDTGFANAQSVLANHAESVLSRHAAEVAGLGEDNDIVRALRNLALGPGKMQECTHDYQVRHAVLHQAPGTPV